MSLPVHSRTVTPVSEPFSGSSSQPYHQVCCLPPPLPLLGRESQNTSPGGKAAAQSQPQGTALSFWLTLLQEQASRKSLCDRSWAAPPEATLPGFVSTGEGSVCASHDTVLHPQGTASHSHGLLETLELTRCFLWTLSCCIWTGPEECCRGGHGVLGCHAKQTLPTAGTSACFINKNRLSALICSPLEMRRKVAGLGSRGKLERGLETSHFPGSKLLASSPSVPSLAPGLSSQIKHTA